ncbi:MAG: dUTP diphosphatase [Desulfovibrio sp.]|nr:dUTP diphosphatase [Desulfovibrio sp.]
MTVKVVNKSGQPLPAYASDEAAGMDVHAFLASDVVIPPLGRALIPTGLRMQIPRGNECQIRPRSGLALNHGITVLNTPGTVDADSRAEIGVVLINLSDQPFTVRNGDRICQMVFKKCERVEWEEVRELDRTKREDGSFGASGLEGD